MDGWMDAWMDVCTCPPPPPHTHTMSYFNIYCSSITASGASGGIGTYSRSWEAVGGYVHAKFDLEKGDKIYIVVGHQGESTRCDQQVGVICL